MRRIFNYFLTRIILYIAIIVGAVVLTEWSGRWLLDKTSLSDVPINFIIALADSAFALLIYVFLTRAFEKREIKELSLSSFGKNALIGFGTGLFLQSAFIFIIYIAGGYSVTRINPASSLMPSLSTALTAGVVGEILIRGVFFRLTEEKSGTMITLIIMVTLFALIHTMSHGASIFSVSATAIQAGLVLSVAYVYSRSLWPPIFLHFAWDLAEPGIFGGINPGNSITDSFFTSEITGPAFLTGGANGPQNSVQAFVLCLSAGVMFLLLASRENNFIKPSWKK